MKAVILAAVILVIFALIFPLMVAYPNTRTADKPGGPAGDSEGPEEVGDTVPEVEDTGTMDGEFKLTLLDGGEVREMSLAQYLRGSLGAEMPASFEPEALKAQAVALRTYLLYKLRVNPSDAHPEADICSDSTCCAAWRDPESLREKWGGDFDANFAKIASAVAETDGLYISYGGEPALAVFHSSSAGRTEDSGNVWNSSLPYLVSVESPESAGDVPNYVSTVTVTPEEFSSAVAAAHPEADFTGETSDWIGTPVYSESGRLLTVTIGGIDVSGRELRSLFSLRSTAVTFNVTGEAIEMTTTGYGHGVGMSQYGANAMAKSGSTFREILENYYPGTEIVENR